MELKIGDKVQYAKGKSIGNPVGVITAIHDEVSVIINGSRYFSTDLEREQQPEAKEHRHPCGHRFDLLDAEFIAAMAIVMAAGAKKYGPDNWKKGLTGENSGINHALKHCMEYQQGAPNDYGDVRMHLAQVAVNAMFEYHLKGKP